MKTGKPFEKGNKIGKGRPRGSRNKRTVLSQQLLDEHAESLLLQAILLARQGDAGMVKALLPYLLPRSHEKPIELGPLPVGTAEEVSESAKIVLNKVAAGEITLNQGRELFELLNTCRLFIETHDHEARIAAIERGLGDSPQNSLAPYKN